MRDIRYLFKPNILELLDFDILLVLKTFAVAHNWRP